jgi:hypothetical protein
MFGNKKRGFKQRGCWEIRKGKFHSKSICLEIRKRGIPFSRMLGNKKR